jgi:ribosomal protein L20
MDRKVLAAIAFDDPVAFAEIVKAVQGTIEAEAEPAAA